MRASFSVAAAIAVALLLATPHADAEVTFGSALIGEPGPAAGCGATLATDNCSFATRQNAVGAADPTSPLSGILTKVRLKHAGGARTVTVRVLRGAGPAFTSVGPELTLSAPAAPSVAVTTTIPARRPIAAGDRLGIGYVRGTGAFVWGLGGGQCYFRQGAGAGGNHPVDTSQSYGTAGCPYEVLLQGVVEGDLDGDGHGDESQDLCPGDGANATTACSGTLVGNSLQAIGNSGAGPGTYFQSAGVSSVVPFDGVVVRWRLKDQNPGTFRLRVLRPSAGGVRGAGTSGPVTVAAAGGGIARADTRLPVRAGDRIGVSAPDGLVLAFGSAADVVGQVGPLPDGAEESPTPSPFGVVLLSADVEADADGDGYGDVTQDGCPADAATQGPCPGPPPAASSSESGGDATAPLVSGLRATNRTFRAGGRGAVAAPAQRRRRPVPRGTAFRFSLSERATLSFVLHRKASGRRVGGRCRKPTARNRRARRCKRYVAAAWFPYPGTAGPNTVPFSGKVRRRGHVRALPAASYRVTVTAADDARNRSVPHRLGLRIVR